MTSQPLSMAGAIPVSTTSRRRFTAEFKRHLVELTLHPGASVARIALAHQLNANQLFKWRRDYLRTREARSDPPPPILLPVEIAPERESAVADPSPGSTPALAGTIDIEMGGARVRVTGSVDPTLLRTVLASLRGR